MAQDDRQSIEKALDAHFGTDVARRLGHLSLHIHSDLSVSRVCTNVGVFLNALRQWSFDFNDPENHISDEARDLIHKLKTSAGHLLEVLDGLVREVNDWQVKYQTGRPVGEDGVFPLARKVKSTFDTPRVKSVLAELQYLEVTVNLINDVVKCAALQTAQMESRSGPRTEADRRVVLRAKLYIRSVIMSHRVAQKYVQQRHAEEQMLWNEAQHDESTSQREALPPRVDLHEDSMLWLKDDIDYNDDHQGAEQQNQLVEHLLLTWADFEDNVASAEGTEIDMEGDEQARAATEQYQQERTFGPLPFREPYPPRTGAAPVAQTAAPPAQRPGPPPPRARQPSLSVDTSHIPAVSQRASAVQGPITYWSIVIGQKHYYFENDERKSDLDIPDNILEARVFSHDNACTEIPRDLVTREAIRAKGYAHAEVPAGRNIAMWSIRSALHWDKVDELIQLTKAMHSPTSSRPPQSAVNTPAPNSQYVTPASASARHPSFGSRPFEATRLGPIQGSPPVTNTGYSPAQGPSISPTDDRRQRPVSFNANDQRIIAPPPGGYVQRQPSDHNPPSQYGSWRPPQVGPPMGGYPPPALHRSQTTGNTGGYGYSEPSRQPPPAPINTQLVRQPRQGQQAPPPPYSSRDQGRDHGRSNRRRQPSYSDDSSSDDPPPRRGHSRGRNATRSPDDDRDYERDHRRIRRLEAANKVAMAEKEQKIRDKRNRNAFARTWGIVASGAALLEGLDAAL